MVTASHNPSYDNGYKVYWSNGCQIIPPHDKGIANAILQNLEPVSWDASVVDGHEPLVQIVPDSVKDRYFEAVCAAAKIPGAGPPQGRPFVYTPMHGVGLPYMQEAVRRLGMERDMVVVKKQAEPDPDFPTVKFPNPEEHGALDLAIQTADRNGIDLVIASDPDADRLAVATKSDGTWHQLSGNQLGVLFASHILSTISKPSERAKTALICTAVSTGMLQAICAAEGVHFEETLTGFKWMGNKALELERSGYNVPFAFEEAIGYMFSRVVHDKDAIAAAAVFLTAAATWRTQHASRGPWEEYQRLAQKYGSFENANTYLISPDAGTTNRVFEDIRGLADPFPATLGARRILRWRDLTRGWDSATDDHVPVLPASGDSQMITCELEGKVKFTVRGSGTEPKIKFYIECQADSAEEAQKGANQVLDDLLKEWFKPEVYGLKLAS
ncbi:MAG: hypothetical protein M4579_006203 [Chaenotheca gracillima]|nr:MAG: hypothetical protein M4579_006203 [Chaenotheca gracillima]